MYPKMHWRRRKTIELGWNTNETLHIFLRYEFYKWYLANKIYIPTTKITAISFLRHKLKTFIKTNENTARRIYKTGLMDKITEDNLPYNLSVSKIENDFHQYISTQNPNMIQANSIILNYFDLQKTRCPRNIIYCMNQYEKKYGPIKNKEDFLNFRDYYNGFILTAFDLHLSERAGNHFYLLKTSVISKNLLSKNLLCIGEYNIINAEYFKQRTNCFLNSKYNHSNLDNMELDVVGGDTIYLLIKNYDKNLINDYHDILEIILKCWNDFILQENYEKILVPGTEDFLDYISEYVNEWHNNQVLDKIYLDSEVKSYLQFVSLENQYL